ncbi:MAG: septum formation initiator family protein [Prosthecochloris sp.]|uniref:FtsB family cell division protein n=1 Tax=Prosthecochloris sp. TaxID=290513 RepID=UPI0025862A20|nr:septum formation initiator family protein [Prosthecochloris sp.]MCW8798886.1 septum formation initiator family protein [Prosthecochloris sp.]
MQLLPGKEIAFELYIQTMTEGGIMKEVLRRLVADIFTYIWSNPKKIFILAVIGVLLVWGVLGDYGIIARLRMEADHRALEARQELEEKTIVENREKIRKVNQPDAVEQIAREKYNFRKDGETLFIIREK